MDEADAMPIADLVDERRYLLDVARGMLGGAGEAERVVDEVYRLWYGLSDEARRRIVRPRAWLAERAGRSCLHRLAGTGQVGGRVGRGDGGPALGRAAAEALSPPPLRESARRGRARRTGEREQDAVVRAVGRACLAGNGELLTSLLCERATAFVDGGGKLRAPDRPVHGRRPVARTLLALLAPRPRTALSAQSVNGRTGLVVRYERRVAAVICLDVTDHGVARVWVVLNPDKLRSWNRPPGPRPART
ncbi:RNA polymerase subunit sigma [Streptomyces sp. NPDC101225]|uniref:RNA polymerase subunit sigma n=1 Tax=Streptomyces sp. NPDC101225 TaxID=3366135 RepID=UPI00382A5902